MSEEPKKPLGRILLKQRAITEADLDKALSTATPGGLPLASRMLEAGMVSEIAALKALSEQSGVPGIDLNQVCIRLSDIAILPREIALRHKILPVLARDDRIFVAMASPTEKKVVDELEFVTGKRVYAYIALTGPLMRAITTAYEMRARGEPFYIGPQCPPEIQRRAGVPTPSAPDAADELGRKALAPPAPTTPPADAPPARRPPPPLPPRALPPPQVNRSEGDRISSLPQVTRAEAERISSLPRTSEPEVAFRPVARIFTPGVTGPGPARPPGAVPAAEGSSASRLPQAPATPVIVDDAMASYAGGDDFTDADFGLADRDLSVMTNLPLASGAGESAVAGQRTILVVDDEPDIRKLLRRVFEDRGFRIIEADRGLAALSLVKEHPPDVIILDAMLPEVHGFDIAKRLKGTERYGHIPIIMISAVYRGWRFAEDLKTSYGVDDYIEKPFRVSDVVKAVENALEKHSMHSRRVDDERISAEAEKMLNAGIQAYKQGDMVKAVEYLREGTRIDALAYRLHYHLGLLYGKQGRVYDAIQELQTALDINGRHFPALKNLAVLYQKAGFRNKAIEVWERALAVAPDEPTRQSIKEHLVGLL
jgi:DNA-binding response OmpR family regulator